MLGERARLWPIPSPIHYSLAAAAFQPKEGPEFSIQIFYTHNNQKGMRAASDIYMRWGEKDIPARRARIYGSGWKMREREKASRELNQEIKTGPRNNKSHNSAYYVRAEIIYCVDPSSECFFLCSLFLSPLHTNFYTSSNREREKRNMDCGENIIRAGITSLMWAIKQRSI
jgi:hypothetical protein